MPTLRPSQRDVYNAAQGQLATFDPINESAIESVVNDFRGRFPIFTEGEIDLIVRAAASQVSPGDLAEALQAGGYRVDVTEEEWNAIYQRMLDELPSVIPSDRRLSSMEETNLINRLAQQYPELDRNQIGVRVFAYIQEHPPQQIQPEPYEGRRNQLIESISLWLENLGRNPTPEEMHQKARELYVTFPDFGLQQIDLLVAQGAATVQSLAPPPIPSGMGNRVQLIELMSPDIPREDAIRIAQVGARYSGGSSPDELEKLIRFTIPYSNLDDPTDIIDKIRTIFPHINPNIIASEVIRNRRIIESIATEIVESNPENLPTGRIREEARNVYVTANRLALNDPDADISDVRRELTENVISRYRAEPVNTRVVIPESMGLSDEFVERLTGLLNLVGIRADNKGAIIDQLVAEYPGISRSGITRIVDHIAANSGNPARQHAIAQLDAQELDREGIDYEWMLVRQTPSNESALRWLRDRIPEVNDPAMLGTDYREDLLEYFRREFPSFTPEMSAALVASEFRAAQARARDNAVEMARARVDERGEITMPPPPPTPATAAIYSEEEMERRLNLAGTLEEAYRREGHLPPVEPAASYKDLTYLTLDGDIESDRILAKQLRRVAIDSHAFEKQTGCSYATNALEYVEHYDFSADHKQKTIVALDSMNHVIGATTFSIPRGDIGHDIHGNYIGTTGKTLGVGTELIHRTMQDPDVFNAMKNYGSNFEVTPANDKVAEFYGILGFTDGGGTFKSHRAMAFGKKRTDMILAEQLRAVELPPNLDADVAMALEKYKGQIGRDVADASGEGFIVGFTDGMNRGNKELGVPRMDYDISFEIVRGEALTFYEDRRTEIIVEGGSTFGGEFHGWADSIERDTRHMLFDSIYTGIAEGKSIKQVADEIQSVMKNKSWEAERIARTEIAAAQFEGMKTQYKEAGFNKVKWLLGENPCDICDEYGKPGHNIYDIDKCPTIPVHPNCRCDIAPVDDTSVEIIKATDEMMAAAKENERNISPVIAEVNKSVGTEVSGWEHRMKSKDSMYTKMLTKYVDALRENPDQMPDVNKIRNAIDDAVRYTSVIPTDNYADGMRRIYDELYARGYKEVGSTNYWDVNKNGGYKGRNTIWKTPEGYEFEIQIHTPESLQMKEETHALYKELEQSTDPKEIKQLQKKINQLYNKVVVPDGAETWVYKRDLKRPISFTHNDWIRIDGETDKRADEFNLKVGAFSRTTGVPMNIKQSVEEYVGNGYKNINGYLRGTTTFYPEQEKFLQKTVEELDEGIEKYGKKLPDDMDLLRGVGAEPAVNISRMKVGDVIADKGFTSLTYETSAAEYFADNRRVEPFEIDELVSSGQFTREELNSVPTTVMKPNLNVGKIPTPPNVETFIRVVEPGSLKGLYIGRQEGEILISRGQRFQIVDKSWFIPTEERYAKVVDDQGITRIRQLRQVITVIPV